MTPLVRKEKRWFPPAEFYTGEKCRRCGVCCGATDGRPCEHLLISEDGSTGCAIYHERLGVRRTTDQQPFRCVPIKIVIESYGGYDSCGYVEEIRSIRKEMAQPTDDLGKLSLPPA